MIELKENTLYKYCGKDVEIVDIKAAIAFGTARNPQEYASNFNLLKVKKDSMTDQPCFENTGELVTGNVRKILKTNCYLRVLNIHDNCLNIKLYYDDLEYPNFCFSNYETILTNKLSDSILEKMLEVQNV